LGEEPSKPADAPQAPKVVDQSLASAREAPEPFMLSEPEVFSLDGDGYSRDLFITSARDQDGKCVSVRVPSRSIRIFRADTAVDEFTKQGGLHWRFRDKDGQVKLTNPASGLDTQGSQLGWGPIVMVIREENTVRCYTMMFDLRC
jgi:hypothetical protein